jgi:hypothetical protein
MSTDQADDKSRHLEALALRAGVYLSPERLSVLEQRIQSEAQRRAEPTARRCRALAGQPARSRRRKSGRRDRVAATPIWQLWNC